MAEAVLASCRSTGVGCSERDEEERGVERERELEVGVDSNRRRFAGGTPSLKVRMGEDVNGWGRGESDGGTKNFVTLEGGFEVEALGLAFIASEHELKLADHMMKNACSKSRPTPISPPIVRVISPPHHRLHFLLASSRPLR
jgi:hypothetical protein